MPKMFGHHGASESYVHIKCSEWPRQQPNISSKQC